MNADLIERLKAAEGPSRELDEEIVRSLYPEAIIDFYIVGDLEKTVFHAQPLVRNKSEVPHFTSSVDAALTLVPDGWKTELSVWPDGHGSVCLWHFTSAPLAENGNMHDLMFHASASTPALALCIAALQARETSDGK